MTLSLLIFIGAALAIFSIGTLIAFSFRFSRIYYTFGQNNNFYAALLSAVVIICGVATLVFGFKDRSLKEISESINLKDKFLTVNDNINISRQELDDTRVESKYLATRTGRSIGFVGLIEPLNSNASQLSVANNQTQKIVFADLSPTNKEKID